MKVPHVDNFNMRTYRIKQILSIFAFINAYLLYWIYRLNVLSENIIRENAGYTVKSAKNGNSLKYLNDSLKWAIDNYRVYDNITINYDKNSSFFENAVILKRDGFYASKYIWIRGTRKAFKEKEIDLKAFIQLYFDEVLKDESPTALLKKIQMKKNNENEFEDYWMLKRKDSEIVFSEEEKQRLQTFGFMLGLAVGTETFLDIKFADHFYKSKLNQDILDQELEFYDPEQYEIYKMAKEGKDVFYCKDDSGKPFRTETNECHFPRQIDPASFDYRIILSSAVDSIFINPFKKSHEQIEIGLKASLRNLTEDFYKDSDKISLREICTGGKSSLDRLDILEWRSLANQYYRKSVFWKALYSLSKEEQLKVYQKVTGLKHVPLNGFKTLPRTKLITGNDVEECKMFENPYEIKLRPSRILSEMINDIRINLK